jgi:hypothetical protein
MVRSPAATATRATISPSVARASCTLVSPSQVWSRFMGQKSTCEVLRSSSTPNTQLPMA